MNIFPLLLQITVTKQLFLKLHINVYFNKGPRFPILQSRQEAVNNNAISAALRIASLRGYIQSWGEKWAKLVTFFKGFMQILFEKAKDNLLVVLSKKKKQVEL